MADFVANNSANGSVICRIINIKAKERRLQNCCRKDDLISERVVIGVDRLWGHMPFVAIYWLTNLGQGKVAFEFSDAG